MRPGRKWLLRGVGFGFALALAFFLFCRLQNARQSARRTMCVHNLKILAIGLESYAEEHDGRFPDRLSALYPTYITTLDVFVCPELRVKYKRDCGVPHPFSSEPTPEQIDSLCSYALVPGLSTSDDKDTVIAYEKVDNHSGMGRSLLYLDGHGAWEPPENWRNGPPNKNLPEGF